MLPAKSQKRNNISHLNSYNHFLGKSDLSSKARACLFFLSGLFFNSYKIS